MFLETIRTAYENAWPRIVIFLSIVVLIRTIYLLTNHKKIVIHEEILNFIFLVYLLMLYELLTSTESISYGINLVPFKEITRYPFMSNLFVLNVLGNIVIFIPFGLFVSRHCKLKNIMYIFMISAMSSFIIEYVQLKIGRAFDIDDIILNVIGGLLGYLIYTGLVSIKKHMPKFLDNNLFYGIIAIVLLLGISYLFFHYIGFGWF